MARTETVQLVRNRYAVLCGLDPANIIDDDATAFLNFLNIAVQEAWIRGAFPYVTKTFAFNVDQFGMVDLSSNTDISEVLEVYDSHPYRTNNASKLKFYTVRDSEVDGVFVNGVTKSDSISVSSITRSSTTATVTTSSDHTLSVGQSVIIAGAVESDYNGTKVVLTTPTTTTFTYTVSGSPSTPATGTITSTKCVAYLYSRIRETVYSSVNETVPFELGKYLSIRASADWLRGEGQEDKAGARLAEAERILLNELDRLERQQQQQLQTSFNPRVTGAR